MSQDKKKTIKLRQPKLLNKTSFSFDERVLSTMDCGIFRMPLVEAIETQPYYSDLLKSAPIDNPEDYEVDIKVHMLMPKQYPCIPNWHCDNVQRDDRGFLDYNNVNEDTPDMLLWLSTNPTTEFISRDIIVETPENHKELTDLISDIPTVKVPSNQWVAMNQHTPHRGTMSDDFQWRVFVRITPKCITPAREVVSTRRRHCQVYLDADAFGW